MLSSELDDARGQCTALTLESTRLSTQLAVEQGRAEKTTRDFAALRGEYDLRGKELQQAQQKTKAENARAESLVTDLSELRKRYQTLQSDVTILAAEFDQAKEALLSACAERDLIVTGRNELTKERDRFRQELSHTERDCARLREECDRLRIQLAQSQEAASQTHEKLREEATRLAAKADQAEETLRSAHAEGNLVVASRDQLTEECVVYGNCSIEIRTSCVNSRIELCKRGSSKSPRHRRTG